MTPAALLRLYLALPRTVRLAAAIVWAAGILYATLAPLRGAPTGAAWQWLGNALHLLFFLGLGALCLLVPRPPLAAQGRRTWIACGAFGALDEFLQGLVGRTPSWFDLGADLFGAGLGVALVLLALGEARRRSAAMACLCALLGAGCVAGATLLD